MALLPAANLQEALESQVLGDPLHLAGLERHMPLLAAANLQEALEFQELGDPLHLAGLERHAPVGRCKLAGLLFVGPMVGCAGML